MFVRVISDFVAWFFKSRTISTVAFDSKSSDKLEARDAAAEKLYLKGIIRSFNEWVTKRQDYLWSNLESVSPTNTWNSLLSHTGLIGIQLGQKCT